ncbi:hypothetical protein KL86PLE_90346 [uncultured Pleomorphomonas sp.]|uniref:Uncharacterized protein n=1 Tax=uncultured Pleomorphomonas sp. TaxID=442121 RepID=A0A212LP56_9HYPH|nr:hypothetical protein KL86PLE_90346 [uncultured Pleomorphomonas sp.]
MPLSHPYNPEEKVPQAGRFVHRAERRDGEEMGHHSCCHETAVAGIRFHHEWFASDIRLRPIACPAPMSKS